MDNALSSGRPTGYNTGSHDGSCQVSGETMDDQRARRRELDERVAGMTIGRTFLDTVAARPDAVALRWKDGEAWRELTWRDYAAEVAKVAAGLRDRGVGRGDRVVLMMRNRAEFHVADVATLFLGATPISIYNSSSPEQMQYLISHSGACAGIFEDLGFLERVLKVRAELPTLQELVVIEDPNGDAPADVARFDAVAATAPLDLVSEVGTAQPDDLATIIYTSGTTGPPKGVMLDHANVCWTVECYRATLEPHDPTGWRALSYLPMAHIAERMSTHYLGMASAFEVTTCPEPGLAAQYLPHARPQTFFAVPRVWEKLHAGIANAMNADPQRAADGQAALEIGWEVSEYRARGEELPEALRQRYAPVEPLLTAVRQMIGLDHMQVAVTGAAPIPLEVLRFFRSLGVPLSEIYGLSETTGPMTWDPYRVRVGFVGRPMPGIEVRLAEDDEVCCRGGNIFRGYLNAPEQTAEVLDADGWFHSGDIGVFDDGYLRIVDRKKELIVTAGGKNISPANIEAALKGGVLIGQACVIGDNRPYVSALVVLDPDSAPGWAKSRGIEATSMAALAEDPDVRAEVEREIGEANARFSRVESVKRFAILPNEWQPDSEELTPTMKLKRRGVLAKYAAEIEALYS
ncbi:MAG: Long-chain-fatty-acid--CoA ligase [Actinomycetia bacterium]|nr:Long-chain-fatty-acid--CoA ligase [Actinomycetes bacterium]